VDDVKMLNFFRFLGLTGGTVVALLVVASVFVQNFWCRYLCPYGALMGVVSLASPLRIRRETSLCIDCGKCAKACPAALPVDKLIAIRSAECTGCLECVAECPAAGALMMAAPRHRRVPAWAMAAGVAGLFLGICGMAQWAGNCRARGENTAFTKSTAVLVAASASPSRTGTTILTSEVSLRWYRMESAINQNLAANSPAIDRKSTRLNSSH